MTSLTNPPSADPSRPPLTRNDKIIDFAIGFIGWWVANGGVWLLLTRNQTPDPQGESIAICSASLMFVNLIALGILAVFRRYIALGVLATYGVNLLIAGIIGAGMNGLCWYPFFVR